MKISEMTNNQASDALAKITECVGNIVDDPEMKPFINEISSEQNTMSMIDAVRKLVPMFVVKHRADVYGVFGALLMKPANAIGDMTTGETFKALKASLNKELMDFFDSLLTRARTTEKS